MDVTYLGPNYYATVGVQDQSVIMLIQVDHDGAKYHCRLALQTGGLQRKISSQGGCRKFQSISSFETDV
jgi:hypothetical protein